MKRDEADNTYLSHPMTEPLPGPPRFCVFEPLPA
jgi:hypothetical protein